MISLAERDRRPELMDQPGLDVTSHRQALEGLRRGNRISNTARTIWRGLESLGVVRRDATPIRVLDVACGGGDVIISLAELARRAGIALDIHGCDISTTAIQHATAAAERAATPNVKFFQLDALHAPLPDDYDVIFCTLFLHHLSEPDALELLRRMAAATRQAVLIDDLVRSRLGYALVLLGTRLVTRSPVVHVDGPLSVRAALSLTEVRDLADRAGLESATIRRHWPERFLLAWRKA